MSQSLISRLLGSKADESEPETTEEKRERELVYEFERVEVLFGFVNGGDRTIEYDKFDGRLGEPVSSTTVVKKVKDGIYQTTRAGVEVEKLCKVRYAKSVREFNRGNKLQVYGEITHEVTPSHVTDRSVKNRTPMQVVVPVTEKVEVREEDGEVVRRYTPHRDGETRIEERD